MARIPYPDPPMIEEKVKELLVKLPAINIFRMLAYSKYLLKPVVKLGNAFFYKGSLDPTLREIAILRVGYLSHASYETYQHERIAKEIGMSDDLIEGIKEGPHAAVFSDLQSRVISYVDDLVKNVRASDQTFEPLKNELGIETLQELTLLTGYYMMISRFLETFEIEKETQSISKKGIS